MDTPSKARMLERLTAAAASSFTIDPFVVFTVAEWRDDADQVMRRVRERSLGSTVIVRSSAKAEDTDVTMSPGLFHSVLDVPLLDDGAMTAAIVDVVRSYGKHAVTGADLGENEVIVQHQIVSPRLSGIAHLRAGSSYIHVDYDDATPHTNTVTSGRACTTVDILNDERVALPPEWTNVRRALIDVRAASGINDVVVEFAVTGDGVVHVFQARPHAAPCDEAEALSPFIIRRLVATAASIESTGSVWSNMTDWNPAELVGAHPQPLAESLYEYVITDNAWLLGRRSLGYRDVRSPRLVDAWMGRPYVRVRSSFLSLTPATLGAALAERLVDDRLVVLRSEPWLHDKVETSVLFTTADVANPRRTAGLLRRGFSSDDVLEIDRHLQTLTSRLVLTQPAWARADVELSKALITDRGPVADAGDLSLSAKLIIDQLNQCRERGVVPFARHARLAFVARDLLARLCCGGAITTEWEAAWLAGVRTVVHDVVAAFQNLATGMSNRPEVDAEVGHLRARTFDICSPRYDTLASLPRPTIASFSDLQSAVVNSETAAAVEKAFHASGMSITGKQFFDFASESVQLRERLKFTFSRVLSDAIENVAALGARVGLERADMAFCTVADLKDIADLPLKSGEVRSWLQERINERREQWNGEASVVAPDVICRGVDLFVVPNLSGRPNFVTDKVSEGDVLLLDGSSSAAGGSLDGRIIAIEAADPGFDWVFASRLAGLVTKYGGATSHMAVRCAQLQVPAAIGCGESLFTRVITSARVRLDCASKEIVTVSVPASVGVPVTGDAL
jgi:phosphohistidine swiveling domain-containing protein